MSGKPAPAFRPFLAALAEPNRQDRPALRRGTTRITYAQLVTLVASAAARLIACDVTPGSRVVVMLPGGVEHLIAVLAVVAAGGIAVPVAPETGPLRLQHVVEDASPVLCVLPGGAAPMTGVPSLALWFDDSGMAVGFSPEAPSVPFDPGESRASTVDGPALIRYSSGSTGVPKGAVLTHGQLVWTAGMISQAFGLDASHRELLVAPISYSGGWQRVAATLWGGGCVTFPRGPLSVTGLLEDLREGEATGFFSPPPLIRMLLATAEGRARAGLASCRSIEIGSASLREDELKQLLDLAPQARVFVHYGLSECSRAVILDARDRLDKLHTVGRPAPQVEVGILDAQTRRLPPRERGEIFVRGPQLAARYWNRPDLNAARFTGGWLATGDYGELDADGYLIYLGRDDDLINVGGHSFFPSEAEAAIGAVQGVAHYAIVGVQDPRGVLGQAAAAFVVPVEAREWSAREFLAQAKSRLPPPMVPRTVVVVPELPLTPSGKPDRRRLADAGSTRMQHT